MPRKFVIAKEIEVTVDDLARPAASADPPTTGAKQLAVIDVNFDLGKGHNFHKHPDQEEVVLVISGMVEQWVDREMFLFSASTRGDAKREKSDGAGRVST